MSSIPNPHGFLEEGFIDFNGETQKTVTLITVRKPAAINIVVFENKGFTGVGNTNPEIDIPVRHVGNVTISSYWVTGKTFNIVTSAEFYGRIYYSAQSTV